MISFANEKKKKKNIYYILPETTKFFFSVCKFVFSLNIMDLSATQTLLLISTVCSSASTTVAEVYGIDLVL